MTISGRGHISLPPDTTVVRLTITGVEPEYSQALEEASRMTKHIKEILKDADMKDKDVKTSRLSVRPNYEYEDNKRYHRGFAHYQELSISFPINNKRLGRILYLLTESHIKSEISLYFTVKEPESAKEQLLRNAIKDAKIKASILADASGVTLGEILSIDYSWGSMRFETDEYDVCDSKMCCNSCAAPSYDIDINPEDIDRNDSVELVFEIK